ncbi:hypothetical protein [Dermacoccus barathri]|uniref:Uncharacterized protein n=1 Tax=Dermacoccus abyssi TaxID=322596 RepID=A0ABX5ZDH6_9MICO|nr:hypothetical protein [Dermacoccus barathri]MBE7372916.1 hypothetical protein [Dermacoccus barathri]QEH94816.1 hypothetical protein FV141_14430 [Dermacoccus abyssi]
MKKPWTTVSAVSGALIVAGTMAPAAQANSFNGRFGPVQTYGYNDAADSFCVDSRIDPHWISATLTPVSRSGPTRTVTAQGGSWNCTSLSRAYEDTRYRAVITGDGGGTRTVYFYS